LPADRIYRTIGDVEELAATAEHARLDCDGLGRCWHLAETWRRLAGAMERQGEAGQARWLRGAAGLLEDAITGDWPGARPDSPVGLRPAGGRRNVG
jgi:hypothetical protein